MLASFKASVLWMDVHFQTRIHVFHGGLLFFELVFYWMLLLASPYSTRGLLRVFLMLLIHSEFLLRSLRFHILPQNSFLSFVSVDLFLCPYHQSVGRIFYRYSGMFWFVLYCLTLSSIFDSPFFRQYLLIFFSSTCVVRFIYSRFLGSSHFFAFLCILSSLEVSLVTASLFVLLVSIPIQVLYFCSGSFGGYQFYHWLVLLLHRLTRSVRWCCPLGYISIIYWLFYILSWLFLVLFPSGW